jgi:signal transduction histidine kinase
MAERIVIVDDSATQLEALRIHLEMAGFRLTVARTGEEALKLVLADVPDLVITDVVMPGMKGYELCGRIKQTLGKNAPPVVLLTSLIDVADIMRGLEAGADNYIAKPYVPAQLVSRVRRVLQQHASLLSTGFRELEFRGTRFHIAADRDKILGFMLSSLEELVRTNDSLVESKRELAQAHARELQLEQQARAQAEADTQRMEALAEKAEAATRARDDVLATVSHDMRNLISTVFTSAALLIDLQIPEEGRVRQLAIIKRTAERMNALIQDLLDVSRIEAGHLRVDVAPENVENVAQEARELLNPLVAAKGARLEISIAPGLPSIGADRGRLLQVLSNLIGNAAKFTPEGGRIVLDATLENDMLLFSVADTGIGISAQDLPHIFDRFWQAGRRTSGGAGLGLAIAKGIVEAHGGSIRVESTPGAGTTFYFTIPPINEQAPVPSGNGTPAH